jgi:ABC-type sugar transport system ATPase subunit
VRVWGVAVMECLTKNVLEIQNVNKRFFGVHALNHVSFSIKKGEIHALVGENGAGKSTIIKILAGVYSADTGTITLNSKKFSPLNPKDAKDAGISVIHQDLQLIPYLTVAENVFLHEPPVKKIAGISFLNRQVLFNKAQQLFDELGFQLNPELPVRKLGRAERQLVEIGKALSVKSKLVIMDEPTASLESKEVTNLMDIIRRLRSNGTTVLFVSHKLDEVLNLCEQVTVLRNGHLVATRKTEGLKSEELIELILGSTVAAKVKQDHQKIAYKKGTPVLKIKNRFTNYNTLEVHENEIVSVTGLLGAGNSDFIKSLCGQKSRKENIEFKNEKKEINNPVDAKNCGIGFIPEDRKSEGLVMNLSVEDNIILPNLENLSKAGIIDRKKTKKITNELIAALDIRTPSAETLVRDLSGGNQQKVVIAKWLASDAAILALIEPTHGIDVGAKVEVHNLIKKFAEERIGVIFSSSELPEIINLSNRAIVFRKGQVINEFHCSNISEKEILLSMSGFG